MVRSSRTAGLILTAMLALSPGVANAAEGAAGFYLLGTKAQMAGFLPPPGTYVQNLTFYYSGDTGQTLDIAGLEVAGGVEANVFYEMPVGLWVAPKSVLGGHLGLNIIVPIGWKDVDAGLSLTGPGGAVLARDLHNSKVQFGDPVPGATLGWHSGSWHWTLGVLVNVPIGFWERGNLANIGFNRTAVDTTAAATWLNPKIGLDVSTAAGVTYNFENPKTNYKTGTEFHIEWAVIQNFSKSFGLGVTGYHYQQITGDSGPGARLGPFKGRSTAVGPTLNYNFAIGKVPVSTNFKYVFDLKTRNRLKGNAALLTITIPLGASAQHGQEMAGGYHPVRR